MVGLTAKELLCLVIGFWEAVQNKALVLTGHGLELLLEESNDVLCAVPTCSKYRTNNIGLLL